MQTKCRPARYPAASHQPPSSYLERRMTRRNRRPELGNRREKAGLSRKPDDQEPKLGVHDFLAGIILLSRAFRGRVGERVYKTYGDKIIVTRVPRFDGYVPSVAQRGRRDKMRAATAYARAVYADPAAKAVYVAAARQLGRQPFRLAVSDFLRGRPRVSLTAARREITRDLARLSHNQSSTKPDGRQEAQNARDSLRLPAARKVLREWSAFSDIVFHKRGELRRIGWPRIVRPRKYRASPPACAPPRVSDFVTISASSGASGR
jgi:hypothetical protein